MNVVLVIRRWQGNTVYPEKETATRLLSQSPVYGTMFTGILLNRPFDSPTAF